jgi:23S rRNA pseudouridine2605 synthase
MEERLQKILARAGLGSRRACDALIAEGRVKVNGVPAVTGQKADPARDEIVVDGTRLGRPERLRYVMLHKPRGVVSSLSAQGQRETVRDLVDLEERLYPVGRLDADSEGLILLTNDGELTDYLTHPRY